MGAEAKDTLRKTVLRRRAELPSDRRAALAKQILGKISELPPYAHSSVVLAYASFGTELPTDGFLERVLGDGKTLVLPRVEGRELGLYGVRDPAQDLAPGTRGIREPSPARGPRVAPEELDFVLVPGVAFDRGCRRLGHGGGFYDRLLGGLGDRVHTVAGAFEVQMVEEVPAGPNDAPVDLVVTERELYGAHDRTMVR